MLADPDAADEGRTRQRGSKRIAILQFVETVHPSELRRYLLRDAHLGLTPSTQSMVSSKMASMRCGSVRDGQAVAPSAFFLVCVVSATLSVGPNA